MKISPTIRRTKPNKDGSFNIKVQVANNGSTSYISTNFDIESLSEWNGKKVINRKDANEINANLHEYLRMIRAIASSISSSTLESMTTTEIKNEILRIAKESTSDGTTVKDWSETILLIKIALEDMHRALISLNRAYNKLSKLIHTL
ncbi:MAG: Arm DNA-binding domain-containing protein [Muribaculum sp.]|nr:Arm DNA-binding domain-containing protein [Muribaculum sp.]